MGREILARSELVGHCGLYCGACAAYLQERCPGCHANEKATWCKVRTCCQDNKYGSCADCATHSDPNACGKFNNFISKLFGLFLRSDRHACITQIRTLGLQGHAENMAQLRRQTIRRGKS